MDRFLPQQDDLGRLIQTRSADLYHRLRELDIDRLGMPPHCLHYFKASHAKRLFFSIETSANLLHRAITLSKKQPEELVIMDYGAGVGTLFLLAKMIGCRKVVYNDHLEDWKTSALLIAEAVGIPIDHYIVGDIGDCLDELDRLHIQCHIITSRNVIEHIYKLDAFYNTISKRQPRALVFSSTTANNSNPAAVIKHRLWHRKWEKVFKGKRMVVIERQAPGLSAVRMRQLARSTRGLAAEELKEAIEEYRRSGKIPDPSLYGSNTCDPANGVWAEHLLSLQAYRKLIDENLYTVSFASGFWDTHYPKAYINHFTAILNRIIAGGGSGAMRLAPFIYVIAEPRVGDHPMPKLTRK